MHEPPLDVLTIMIPVWDRLAPSNRRFLIKERQSVTTIV
jgi:hypothetical protein